MLSQRSDPDPYAVPLLEWALGYYNWGVRVSAVKAVAERGNEASITKLEPLLKDEHYQVRNMAAASIVKLSARKQTVAGE